MGIALRDNRLNGSHSGRQLDLNCRCPNEYGALLNVLHNDASLPAQGSSAGAMSCSHTIPMVQEWTLEVPECRDRQAARLSVTKLKIADVGSTDCDRGIHDLLQNGGKFPRFHETYPELLQPGHAVSE
jgi:hypothetical protein